MQSPTRILQKDLLEIHIEFHENIEDNSTRRMQKFQQGFCEEPVGGFAENILQRIPRRYRRASYENIAENPTTIFVEIA